MRPGLRLTGGQQSGAPGVGAVAGMLLATVLAATTGQAASRVDPAYRFRTLATTHFVIYFHQGEDQLAARLASIAEETWLSLRRPLGRTPPPLTHVVLVDQTEQANGWASPLPYNTLSITAVWPAGSDFIGNTDDWMRLAFTHEFTHIVHLDRSEGWARVVRGIFGRVPIAFPNLFLPTWQIEGLATYEESAITGQGRLHAGDFRAIVTQAARGGTLNLDQINGGLTRWPGGLAPYAYGLGFHAYLADRFGVEKLGELAEATAGRVPFTASRVFRSVYGRPLGELWREYQSNLTMPTARDLDVDATRLTRHGFFVSGPRFTRPSCGGCPAEVVYSVRTPHAFPSLNRLKLDGTPPERLTGRYLGSTAAVGGRTLYFDQQEMRRNTGLYSDLYALDRGTGRVRRLTSEARLLDPDLSHDERTLVCVQDRPGRRDLVLVRLTPGVTPDSAQVSGPAIDAITTLVSAPETQFNAPRWSPDDTTIAVQRHRAGSQSEIVLVDVATGAVRVAASHAQARFVTPAWRPDGRAVIVAADLNDGPFNLYEVALGERSVGPTLRRLTNTTGGALWPDVTADGRTIVYAGYTSDGFDLFQMPYPAPAHEPDGVPALSPDPAAKAAGETGASAGTHATENGQRGIVRNTGAYSPLGTMKPTSWSPIVTGDSHQVRVGITAGGSDVLAYHAYAASASWLAGNPSSVPKPSGAAPDWQLAYTYDRWRPTLWVTASSDTSFYAGPPTLTDTPRSATVQERQIAAGLFVPIRHVRVSQRALASVNRLVDDYTFFDGTASRNRTALRAGWTIMSAQAYGYSISPEGGLRVGVTAEVVRRAFGASGDANTFTVDSRAYLPGLAPHHVVALRVAAGTSSGDADALRAFHLGGAAPNPDTLDFGRQAASLLRGFPGDAFAGRRVALVNADYRWPIARPERGIGTWPVLLHTVHAAVFGDAGHAWNTVFRAADIKTSAGAELSVDLVVGYSLPFTLSFGAAWGHDGSVRIGTRSAAYVRVGRAF